MSERIAAPHKIVSVPDETQYSWTQPICDDCWDIEHPDRPSPRAGKGALEHCCKCAEPTMSGIYIRVDPRSVRWPTREKDSA